MINWRRIAHYLSTCPPRVDRFGLHLVPPSDVFVTAPDDRRLRVSREFAESIGLDGEPAMRPTWANDATIEQLIRSDTGRAPAEAIASAKNSLAALFSLNADMHNEAIDTSLDYTPPRGMRRPR